MGLNYYASAPTVVLPPQQPHGYLSAHQRSRSPSPMSSFRPKFPTPPSLNYLAAVSNGAAGRKRSIADVDEPEENLPNGSIVTQAPQKPKPEPIYGPGMTLIYPDEPGFHLAAESQTGTWREEKQEKEEKVRPVRPIAFSRKSQRMDSATDITIPSLNDMAAESIIDDNGNTIEALITSLGVGWKNVMTNPTLRDAARAYSRVIENHFDLTEAVVLLEKESLSAYLVRAKQHGVQGYFLFSDSLQWCQLVGWSLQRTISNLLSGPVPRVEGERVNARQRTPSEPSTPPALDVDMSVAIADTDAMEL